MSPQSCMVTSEECGCTGESESRMKVKWKTSHPMMQQQHVNHSVLNHKYWIWHLHMATYSSSRCLCDSTMVTGQCGRGRDQLFEGESCAAAALSSVRRWAVLIQATRARTSRVLQLVGSWVSSRQKKTQTERRGTQESAPPWTAWLQGQEKWRACRPVTSQVYTASEERERKEGKSTLGMHDREHEEWVGMKMFIGQRSTASMSAPVYMQIKWLKDLSTTR